MKVWVRLSTRTLFPDTTVTSDVEVFDHRVEQSFEREVQELKPCNCSDLPFPDNLGYCSKCGGSLVGHVTASTKLIEGQAYEPHAGHAALSEDGQPLHFTYWMTQRSEERCHSMLNRQRCQKFHGHPGLHQECSEVWGSL